VQSVNNKKIKESLTASIEKRWMDESTEGRNNKLCGLYTRPSFFKAVEVGEKRESAEYIAGEMIKVIEEVGPLKMSLLAADNAANMKRALEIVKEKYPHIGTRLVQKSI